MLFRSVPPDPVVPAEPLLPDAPPTPEVLPPSEDPQDGNQSRTDATANDRAAARQALRDEIMSDLSMWTDGAAARPAGRAIAPNAAADVRRADNSPSAIPKKLSRRATSGRTPVPTYAGNGAIRSHNRHERRQARRFW